MAGASLYGNGLTSDDMTRLRYSPAVQKTTEHKNANSLVKRYLSEVARYDKSSSDWYEEGENIVKLYMSESDTGKGSRKFPLLYSNVQTLQPNVYVKPPAVLCSRRYKDRDPIGRTAAEILERGTNTTFELYGVDEVFRMVRDDRLLPGRGQAWVRYEADIEQQDVIISVPDPQSGENIEQSVSQDKVTAERACIDYVYWSDFGHNVARIWKDVWLVWRIVYKTKDEVIDRFGSEKAASLNYSSKLNAGSYKSSDSNDSTNEYCQIYEFWDKRNKVVAWLADGESEFLDFGEPPINFSGFFPCPEPCYATKTSKGLIPKPDYIYYRDSAKQINDLTDKIHNLSRWLIVKGFIPSGPSTIADPIEEALRDKGNAELFVPVESMTEWAEKGGAAKLIDWLPIDQIVAALQAAIQARSQLVQDVYQLTGIADILRGQSDPDETFGAVNLRAQTGTRRLRNTKDEIARFCRDIARLTAEVIAEQFSPQSLAEISGFRYQPPPPPMMANMTNVAMFPGSQPPVMGGVAPAMVANQRPGMAAGMGHNGGPPMNEGDPLVFDDQVVELLRNDMMRSFRIEIETDSTIQADEQAEKDSRTELLTAVGNYLGQASEIVNSSPAMAEMAGELLMFAVRTYRPGRTLEETIERGFQQLVQQKQTDASKPPEEDPVIAVAKTQVAGDIEKNRVNAQLKAQEIQTDAALEVRKQNLDAQLKIRQQGIDATAKARDAAARMTGRLSRLGMNPMASPSGSFGQMQTSQHGVA